MVDNFANLPITKQKEKLIEICLKNPNLKNMLEELEFPHNFKWYLSGGCINETVWNYLTGRDIAYGIDDYDLVYWDEDTSYEAEDKVIKSIQNQISKLGLDITMDIKNEARVHIWYKEKYGKKIDQYENLEHAISSWPATITCVGLGNYNNEYIVAAPYGLSDIFNMVLKANCSGIVKKILPRKLIKWTSRWPELKIVN